VKRDYEVEELNFDVVVVLESEQDDEQTYEEFMKLLEDLGIEGPFEDGPVLGLLDEEGVDRKLYWHDRLRK